jgi:ribonuclease D
MLLQSLGCRPVNLYDTGVAIRLLDFPQTSLGTVLMDLLGVEVNKDAQKSNWFNRPLTTDQLNYAAQDVLHLFPLMDLIEDRVNIAERKEWVRQENLFWQEMDYSLSDQVVQLKDNDKKDMNQVQWHVYGKLMELREIWAQEHNLPSGRVMRTDYVKEIVLKNGLRYWEKNRSTNNVIRTSEKKELVIQEMKRAEQEALDLGLSKDQGARERWSKEEYQKFKEEKRRKETLLANMASPIQTEMAARYGENTATYILSNRAAMDVIEGRLTSLPEYRVKLFEEIASSLSIDASPILENLNAIEFKA